MPEQTSGLSSWYGVAGSLSLWGGKKGPFPFSAQFLGQGNNFSERWGKKETGGQEWSKSKFLSTFLCSIHKPKIYNPHRNFPLIDLTTSNGQEYSWRKAGAVHPSYLRKTPRLLRCTSVLASTHAGGGRIAEP